MARFTLPRDIYHGKGCLAELKNLKGKKAVLVVGGGSMKRQGFLDKAVNYLKEGGMEVEVFEGVEPDPSVETVMKGAKVMQDFQPDWIVSMGGGSPIDAAKAMWAFYEYPETKFEDLIVPFGFPELRQKAKFAAIPTTSGTATEVTAFSVITDYAKGIKYPLADFNITPDVAIVDPELVEALPAKQVLIQEWTHLHMQLRRMYLHFTVHLQIRLLFRQSRWFLIICRLLLQETRMQESRCTTHSVLQECPSPMHCLVLYILWRIRQVQHSLQVIFLTDVQMQFTFHM